MSSPDNKDYGELEQSMWRRFQDAEAMPGPEVWSRIDHALAMQENEKYKNRALFYRQLAAACFILFILAGSALVLHFKQDQEQGLAAVTAQSQATSGAEQIISNNKMTTGNGATIAGNRKINLADNGATNYTLQEAKQETITAMAQVQAADYSYPREAGASNLPDHNYTTVQDPATTINQTNKEKAGKLIATATEVQDETIPAGTQERTYIPAEQAIANVPDNYTSPETINPLLRRNAILGSIPSEVNTPERIALQKQADLTLALNSSAESEKTEKETSRRRWNVGMAYGSAYFAQNINIPGYTVTPKINGFGVVPDPRIRLTSGPAISEDSELNMRDARIEFKEKTQAAMSYNVDAKAGFKIGKRLKILTGLGYSQNTSRTKTSYIVEQFVFKPRTNERTKLQPTTVFLPSLHTFTTDSISVVKTKEPFDVDYSYQMLSVPVGVQVEGGLGQKWYWYAAGSMAANFLMQTSITAANPEIASVTYSATDDSPFRKVQFSGNVSMGIGKHISNAVTISVGPEYRSFFNAMLTDDKAVATQGRPYTIGLNMGVNYTLGQNGK